MCMHAKRSLCVTLTSLLPCYLLKMANKRAKSTTLKPFCVCFSVCLFFFLFSHWHVKGLSSKCITLKVDVIGLGNILFVGASVHLSVRKFNWLQQ